MLMYPAYSSSALLLDEKVPLCKIPDTTLLHTIGSYGSLPGVHSSLKSIFRCDNLAYVHMRSMDHEKSKSANRSCA